LTRVSTCCRSTRPIHRPLPAFLCMKIQTERLVRRTGGDSLLPVIHLVWATRPSCRLDGRQGRRPQRRWRVDAKDFAWVEVTLRDPGPCLCPTCATPKSASAMSAAAINGPPQAAPRAAAWLAQAAQRSVGWRCKRHHANPSAPKSAAVAQSGQTPKPTPSSRRGGSVCGVAGQVQTIQAGDPVPASSESGEAGAKVL